MEINPHRFRSCSPSNICRKGRLIDLTKCSSRRRKRRRERNANFRQTGRPMRTELPQTNRLIHGPVCANKPSIDDRASSPLCALSLSAFHSSSVFHSLLSFPLAFSHHHPPLLARLVHPHTNCVLQHKLIFWLLLLLLILSILWTDSSTRITKKGTESTWSEEESTWILETRQSHLGCVLSLRDQAWLICRLPHHKDPPHATCTHTRRVCATEAHTKLLGFCPSVSIWFPSSPGVNGGVTLISNQSISIKNVFWTLSFEYYWQSVCMCVCVDSIY